MGIKDTKLFKRWCRKAFNEIDVDKTGKVDYKEVCIGILKIYDSLNAKFPAHVLAPKRQEVWDLCRKYDSDGNGFIDFDEFLEMAKVLVGSRTNFRESLPWKYFSVLVLKLVICPLAAAGIVKLLLQLEAPYADRLPVAPLASLIEIGLKMASKMAKFGEGDPRWLVEKRDDGTNVNAWHWKERDCMPWAKTRLAELLGGLTLVDNGSIKVHATGLESVTGDVFLNVRKAKLIPSYELAIKACWEGSTAEGQAGKGFVELPYVADENADEDPELRVVLPVEDKPSQLLKEAILTQGGKQAVLKAIHTFISELQSGVPAQQQSGSKAATDPAAAATATTAAGSSNGTPTSSSGPAAAPAAAASKPSKSRCTVKLTEQFYAKAQDIFECFTVQGRVQAFTRSPAVVEPQPGGSFSWFSGHVSGTFEELQPGKRLVFSWRFNNWEDGCFSKVVIELAEPEPGNTVLSLLHTGLPEEDKFGHSDVQQQVEQGWQQQVFSSIKMVFGYGV